MVDVATTARGGAGALTSARLSAAAEREARRC